jgi:hypothetical protein
MIRSLIRPPAIVLIITAAAYAVLLPAFLTRLDPLTGDEPFYVMTAISIVRDGDLDEANNYADRDYLEFYPELPLASDWQGWKAFPARLPPHPAHARLDGLYSKHGLGLALMIALPYELFGRVGAVLVIVLCATLLSGQMYRLGRDAGASSELAAIVAILLAVSMPIAPYALLIFPEIPAALLIIVAVRQLGAPVMSVGRVAGAAAAIGFLPWLHQRFAPTAAVLGALLIVRALRARHGSRGFLALTPLAIGAGSLMAYNLWLYRSPLQSSADHAGFHGPGATLNALFGLLLDAQWGLLIAAPVFLVAIVTIPDWIRAERRTALVAIAAVLPYILVVAAYRVWWGEWGPPARYLVPIVPLAAGPLCAWVARSGVVARLFALGLWSCGMVLSLIGFADPQRFYHHPDGNNHLVQVLDDRLSTGIASHLIAFQPYAHAPSNERVAISLLLVSIVVGLAITLYAIPRLVVTPITEAASEDAR